MSRRRSDSLNSQSRECASAQLDMYYNIAKSTIMEHLDPVTGLLSSSEFVGQAWVRDNVYTSIVLWSLSLAYRKMLDITENKSKWHELEQAVVKLMRGLLQCMMGQIAKVEAFKHSMSINDALHAKYSSRTCETVVGDHEYGHLQLDATSLFILMLAQMTSSGINIVFTLDEVRFIQNLVFYIQSAYMTPDFGIWERGDKTNHGVPELNTTSVAMSKAALEAIDELNLFGANGGLQSVVHVSPDFIVWCNDVIKAVLPRESTSKETDAALLSVIGFPAFAVDDMELIERTRSVILSKLQGNYGLRRFLRDGFKCPREDSSRLYYEPEELKLFDNIECEWPMFWAYLLIEAIFRGNDEKANQANEALETVLLRDKNGYPLMPQLYSTPADKIDAEIENPHSQKRIPVGQIPFGWGQSLYLVSQMLRDKLIFPGELDPLNRRLRVDPRPDTIVQVCLLTDSCQTKAQFADLGVTLYTIEECAPFAVYHVELLQEMLGYLGRDDKLQLSGNPASSIGALSTSKLYSLSGNTLAFIPELFQQGNFYTLSDIDFLLDSVRNYLAVVEKDWKHITGRPTVIFFVSSNLISDTSEPSQEMAPPPALISACKKLASGYFGGVRVNCGKLTDFLSTSCISNLDFLFTSCDRSGIQDSNLVEMEAVLNAASYADPCKTCGNSLHLLATSSVMGSVSGSASGVRKLGSSKEKVKHPKTLTDIRNSFRRSLSIYKIPKFVLEATHLHRVSETAVEAMLEDDGAEDLKSASSPAVTSADQQQYVSHSKKYGRLRAQTVSDQNPQEQQQQPIAITVEEATSMLASTNDMFEQAGILRFLHTYKGLGYRFKLGDREDVLLADLIKELYEQALAKRQWQLIRLCAGMLGRRCPNISNILTSILIHNKQVSVGFPERPPFCEMTFSKPVTMDRLLRNIEIAYAKDVTLNVLTQEMLISLGSIIGTEPHLFQEMLRIRVGLLINVLCEELQSMHSCGHTEAVDRLFDLPPYKLKLMLRSLLIGREISASAAGESRKSIGGHQTIRVKGGTEFSAIKAAPWMGSHRKSLAVLDIDKSFGIEQPASEVTPKEIPSKQGQWLRRRRIDGSLNRVPVGFYERIWQSLQKCHGFKISNRCLSSSLTREMTREEMKFALEIENAINQIPTAHYRQLIVEAIVMTCLLLLSNTRFFYHGVVDLDAVVHQASAIFCQDEKAAGVPESALFATPNMPATTTKTTTNSQTEAIALAFFDCAPSGRYGTMNYMLRALFTVFNISPDSEWNIDTNLPLTTANK